MGINQKGGFFANDQFNIDRNTGELKMLIIYSSLYFLLYYLTSMFLFFVSDINRSKGMSQLAIQAIITFSSLLLTTFLFFPFQIIFLDTNINYALGFYMFVYISTTILFYVFYKKALASIAAYISVNVMHVIILLFIIGYIFNII